MFIHQNVFHLHQQRCVILRVNNLAIWKINNEENGVWVRRNPKKFSSRFLELEIFLGGLSRNAVTPLNVALSPFHSYITKFLSWSRIARHKKSFESRRENSKMTTGTVEIFDPRSGISGPASQRASAFPNLQECLKQPVNVCSPAIDLVEIRRCFKISWWIWTKISGVVNVLGCPERGI